MNRSSFLPGALLLCLGMAAAHPQPALAWDVAYYMVEKGISYLQSQSAPASPESRNAYVFRSRLFAESAGRVASATVRTPAGRTHSLADEGDGIEFEYRKREDTLAELNSAFPDGEYRIEAQTTRDGKVALPLSLTGGSYPPLAHLLEHDSLQALDAGRYLLVRWQWTLTGPSPDYAQLRIEDAEGDKVFETPDSGAGSLDGRFVQFLLPRGTLRPGQVYTASILSRKTVFLNTTSYEHALGEAAYYRRASFPIRTLSTAVSGDANVCSLWKIRIWKQSGNATPLPDNKNGFVFDAEVNESAAHSVRAASVQGPSGSRVVLEEDSDGSEFEHRDRFDTAAELDAAYPDGTYRLALTGARQGSMEAAVLLSSPRPAPLMFEQADQAAAVEPARDFELRWRSTGEAPLASDYLELRIEDSGGRNVFDSPGFGKAKILSGVRTSFVIPSNTLQSNQTYTARLRFFRLSHLDTRSLPGALVVAGHVAETRLPLQTAAASGPRITRVSYHPAQGMILAFRSESGAWYEVQWSSNFSRWELAGTVPGQSGETEYSDPQGLAAARRFYRVVKR